MARKLLDVAWLIVMAFLAVWAVTSLWWPWGRDQSTMGFMGHLIIEGKMPYRDAIDINAPGGHLLHALLETVAGTARWPLRLMDLGFLALTGWALFGLGKALHSVRAGLWAFALFVLFYASAGFWNTAQRDGWAAMMLSWGLLLTCGASRQRVQEGRAGATTWVRGGLAGLLLGLAVLLKPLYVGLALPLLIWMVERGKMPSDAQAPPPETLGGTNLGETGGPDSVAETPARRAKGLLWGGLAAGLLGMILPLVAVLLWLDRGHALRPAYEQVVLFNSRVYSKVERLDLLSSCAVFVASLMTRRTILLTLVALIGGRYLFATRVPGRWALAVAWPAVTAAIIIFQGRFFSYHWHGLHLGLALLGGIGLMELATWEARPAPGKRLVPRWAPVLVALLLLALLVLPPSTVVASEMRWWVGDVLIRRDYELYMKLFANRDVCPRVNAQVGAYLAAHTTPTDTILQWGLEPDLYLYSGRDPASPLWASFFLTATLDRNPELHLKLLQQLLGDLKRNRPRYFVVVDNDRNAVMRKTSRQSLKDEPLLDRYVRENYCEETRIEDFQLLRRR